MPHYRPALERFEEKLLVAEDGCWNWIAGKTAAGYGLFAPGNGGPNAVTAHRWSYEHWVGPIPEGLDVDHLCHNRACVNPAHLEPVTKRENAQRKASTHRTRGLTSICGNRRHISPHWARQNAKSA